MMPPLTSVIFFSSYSSSFSLNSFSSSATFSVFSLKKRFFIAIVQQLYNNWKSTEMRAKVKYPQLEGVCVKAKNATATVKCWDKFSALYQRSCETKNCQLLDKELTL